MKLASVLDKRLSSLIKSNSATAIKGLTPQEVKKLRRQISAVAAATTPKQIAGMPGWNVHELTPGYPGKWSMTVTPNYRLTFYFLDGEARDLNFEDYH